MRKRIKGLYNQGRELLQKVSEDRVGAYAAQSAFFILFSMIPIILLLMTMVRYTPVTKADVLTAVLSVFPTTFDSMITSIVNQVYNESMAIVPVTIVTALWAAGKGLMALAAGLNVIYDYKETRNYIQLRLRGTFYTVLLLLVIFLALVMSVFGHSITSFVEEYIPLGKDLVGFIVSASGFVTPFMMIGLMLLMYRFLPNRKDTFFHQLPGAVFTTIGWMIISWIFSIYLDVFTGFSTMYGSMTTIVLIMLWMYFTMYIALLGGEVNVFVFGNVLAPKHPRKDRAKLEDKQEPELEDKEAELEDKEASAAKDEGASGQAETEAKGKA